MSQILDVILQAFYTGAVWALVGVAFGFIARTTNIFHLALGGIYAIGAYGCFFVATVLGAPVLVAAVMGVLFAGIAGGLLDWAVYQPVTGLYGQRKIDRLSPFIASLGALIVMQNGVQLIFGASPLYLGTPDWGVASIGGSRVLVWNLVKIGISFAAIAAFAIWLTRTRAGASALALGQSPEGASVVGISERAVRMQIFFATGMFGGLAGVLAILTHPTLPHDGLAIVIYGALISLILPKANVMVWWLMAVAAALIYAGAIAAIGGGWHDIVLQSALMTAVVISRIIVPAIQRRRILEQATAAAAHPSPAAADRDPATAQT